MDAKSRQSGFLADIGLALTQNSADDYTPLSGTGVDPGPDTEDNRCVH